MTRKLNHIELFAGCGGMSLGFAAAGFELLLANELSSMAAETFARNILDLDLTEEDHEPKEKVFWINSAFPMGKKRLRENPFTYPRKTEYFDRLIKLFPSIKGSLLVGNITHLNELLEASKQARSTLQDGFGAGAVDLVSGGPPCQSFSLAGLREKDNEKNKLPWEFAKFVSTVQPRVVLLENVTGILRPFTEDGVKYHAWFEVARAFAQIDYIPICLHLNAKFCGVAQNRPRFIMIAIRKDNLDSIKKDEIKGLGRLTDSGYRLFHGEKRHKPIDVSDMEYFDAHKEADLEILKASFLKPLISKAAPKDFTSVKDAIGDLSISHSNSDGRKSIWDVSDHTSEYVRELNKKLGQHVPPPTADEVARADDNNEKRRVSPRVQRRFRIYQNLHQVKDSETRKAGYDLLAGKSGELPMSAWNKLKELEFLVGDKPTRGTFESKADLEEFFAAHQTKKQTQRALDEKLPAPAALSIPDDACHWSEARTLTVREMARIQSFPDNFIFKSKVTTGGTNRRFEVPQYTQIGNAVPPLFALRLGEALSPIITKLSDS